MKLAHLLILLFFLGACQSFQPIHRPQKNVLPPKKGTNLHGGGSYRREPMIKFALLEDRLGFHDYAHRFGIQEKTFNPCMQKDAFSYPVLCHDHYLTVVHLDIRCRESEGTVEQVYHSELSPLRNRRLEWSVGRQKGMSQTDYKGRAKISILSDRSVKYQRIRLQAGTQFLVMRLNQLKRLVVPPQWCGRFG